MKPRNGTTINPRRDNWYAYDSEWNISRGRRQYMKHLRVTDPAKYHEEMRKREERKPVLDEKDWEPCGDGCFHRVKHKISDEQ